IKIEDFFMFDGAGGTYSGTGNFFNFKNVYFEFYVSEGGYLNFASFNVDVTGVSVYLDGTIVNGSDGSTIKNSHRVLTTTAGGNYSSQTYFIDVSGPGGKFTWIAHNFFKGSINNVKRVSIHGNRLAGYLTQQFTGTRRKDTEDIPY
nr:hypothetical protein [Bacteroidota bacterium]